MNQHPLTIETASGETFALDLTAADAHLTLSEWLEDHAVPLNTRCGGKGVCRGCGVEFVEDGCVTLRRSCEVRLADIPETLDRVRIPESSWRDQGLHGISIFEVRATTPAPRLRPGLGLALDIGTTTVAGALWDLASGQCLSTVALPNAQRRYGDNVLARIDHTIGRGGDSGSLQKSLVDGSLKPLIERLCQEAKCEAGAITEAAATGNTIMLHALVAASLAGFGAYPFRPVFLEERKVLAREIALDYDFPILLPPCLGSFVGADITAGALAAGMLEEGGPFLLIDFGTNGEILLRHEDGFLATATAAGPAFEGGRLSCGAPAGRGVVSSMDYRDGRWHLIQSGNDVVPLTGISGAAYVDFLALARREGMLGDMGRLDRQHREVLTRQDGSVMHCGVRIGPRLEVTEEDVAELIQAKAAIAGGVMTLLELAGLEPEDLRALFIAGGFGYNLNLEHAAAIGLIPSVSHDRIHVIGNASLGGASLLLLHGESEAISPLLRGSRVVELNQTESFEDHFIDAMSLTA